MIERGLDVETKFYVHSSSGISPPDEFDNFGDAQRKWRDVHGTKHYLPGAKVKASIIRVTKIVEDCTPK